VSYIFKVYLITTVLLYVIMIHGVSYYYEYYY